MKRYHVYGRVQGVGFRAFVWREAAAIGIDGWVRNNLDGTVEVFARASEEEHEQLTVHLRDGPRWSRVDRVNVVEEPDSEMAPGFGIV